MDPVHAGPARPQAGSGLSVEAPTLPAPADLRKPEDPLSAEPEDPLSAAPAPEPWPPAPQLAAAEPQPPPAARHTFLERRLGQAPQTTEPAVHPKEARKKGDTTRGLRPPPHVSSPSGQRRGEAAVRCAARELCADAAFGSRPPPVASRLIAVWTAAWQGGYVLAPPLDSRRPSVASRLRHRLYSGEARQLCAGQRRG